MDSSTRVLPALDMGETYTDPDFLLVQTNTDRHGQTLADIDRMFAKKRESDSGSWGCKSITSRTKMSHEAALGLARAYAEKHEIPVIYEQQVVDALS